MLKHNMKQKGDSRISQWRFASAYDSFKLALEDFSSSTNIQKVLHNIDTVQQNNSLGWQVSHSPHPQCIIVRVSIFTPCKQAIGFLTVCILKPCRRLFKSIRAKSPHWLKDAGRALAIPLYCYHTNSCLMRCIIPVCGFCPNLIAFKCI